MKIIFKIRDLKQVTLVEIVSIFPSSTKGIIKAEPTEEDFIVPRTEEL